VVVVEDEFRENPERLRHAGLGKGVSGGHGSGLAGARGFGGRRLCGSLRSGRGSFCARHLGFLFLWWLLRYRIVLVLVAIAIVRIVAFDALFFVTAVTEITSINKRKKRLKTAIRNKRERNFNTPDHFDENLHPTTMPKAIGMNFDSI
jgi:hypothetical protein